MKTNNDKTIDYEIIHLNIHSLLHILSLTTTPSVKKYLKKNMGSFISKNDLEKKCRYYYKTYDIRAPSS